jgi:hypothetical protein
LSEIDCRENINQPSVRLLLLLSFLFQAYSTVGQTDANLSDNDSFSKIDSIVSDFNTAVDGISRKYQTPMSAFNEDISRANRAIDSLERLKLPTKSLSGKVDSLVNEKQNMQNEFKSNLELLKSKTLGKIDKLEMTPGMETSVAELKTKVGNVSVSNINVEGSLGNIVTSPLPDVPTLTNPLGSIDEIDGLSDLSNPLKDITQLTNQVNGISEDVGRVENLTDVDKLSEIAEQQASKLDGVQELQKQSAIADQYQGQLTNLNDPKEVKKQAEQLIRKQAINHFAGKEEQLKSAMEKFSKYKRSYTDVPSINDLPKRPPNAMKGKPFIERLVPGLSFQFQNKSAWLVDVNPYAGYRISGRFIPGLGWNQRFAYDKHNSGFISEKRIFGPRVFVDTKLLKGFTAHLEGEFMNTLVPSGTITGELTPKRTWAKSIQIGLKKEYTIYKNLQGTVLLQYNFVNEYFKTPYVDRLNSRMGFEYRLKVKKTE